MRRSRPAPPARRNWSGSVIADPVRIEHPRSVGEVVTAVRRALEQGLRLKPVGSGHSFSPVAAAPDVQLRLDGMTGLVSVDPAARRATLRAGTPLHAIPALLDPLGRPHWGKMHDLDHGALAARLPRMGDFVTLRDRLDPDRLFANPYLDEVLPSPARDSRPTTA